MLQISDSGGGVLEERKKDRNANDANMLLFNNVRRHVRQGAFAAGDLQYVKQFTNNNQTLIQPLVASATC